MGFFAFFKKVSYLCLPNMRSKLFKYGMMFILLIAYINRGLFVAMPGVETSLSSDVNSLLEMIINWTGLHNDIDEDGDSPENYGTAKTVQPLIDPNVMYACLTCPYATVPKIFYLFDEVMLPLDAYGTIDHPPEMKFF